MKLELERNLRKLVDIFLERLELNDGYLEET